MNATTITDGGTAMRTMGHEEEVQSFVQMFRRLPMDGFVRLRAATDPLALWPRAGVRKPATSSGRSG